MSESAIKVENISKAYRIGLKEQRHDTLGATMAAWVKSPFQNFKRLKSLSNFNNHDDKDIFWALRNIDFQVSKGEVLGIIGKNGAGKSTLLKILSRITEPTTGKIEIYGRVASLLEVGTGFNPELTGRENVYLNGTILGMKKKEIDDKFDEIIDFSGVEKFLDTAVKRYSSGMKVRLAFAVAAHLDPEILVIDEVLAVGDAEFQSKCLGKMQDLSGKHGRTVLFVSHNMAAVKSLCTKAIVLENGKFVHEGSTDTAVDYYLRMNQHSGYVGTYNKQIDEGSGIASIALTDKFNESKTEFGFDEPVTIHIKVKIDEKDLNSHLGFRVVDINETVIFTSEIKISSFVKTKGLHEFEVKLPVRFLVPNKFKLTFGLHVPNKLMIDYLEECLYFEIVETGSDLHQYAGNDYGCVFVNCNWGIV